MAACEIKREFTIVLVGKSGSGKSVLMDALDGDKASADPVTLTDSDTETFSKKIFTHNGYDFRIIDTPGLTGKEDIDTTELKMCSAYTNGKINLFIYCLPVGAGHKFDDINPKIMKHLTDGFGKQIWDHCILVFTMSNLTMSDYKEEYPDEPEQATEEYKQLLTGFADSFQKQLLKLGVKKQLKTIFDVHDIANINNTDTIIAVPSGKNSHSHVFPDMNLLSQGLSELEYTSQQKPEIQECTPSDPNWTSIIADTIQEKCTTKSAPSMIMEYNYGNRWLVVIGAITGAVIGNVLIPCICSGLGAAVGVLAGLVVQKKKTVQEKEHVQQKLDKRQNKE